MFRVNRLKIVSSVVRSLSRIRITGCPKKATFSLVIRGTVIPDNYIESRKSSFQAHLERISNFLIPGPGVWWEKGNGTVVFRDGDKDLVFFYNTSAAVVSQMYSMLLPKCEISLVTEVL